ncbi:MAG: hypothetical protein HYZ79_07390, partial [Candidatus Melainabacteria bacterium]|nr:hypothetical protein [Candidatus Melainabacteria bacterium]
MSSGEISYTEVSAVLKNQVADPQNRELGKKNLIYIELSRDFLSGLKDGGLNEINTVFTALQEPEAIMFVIATSVVFVGLSASTVFLAMLPVISTILLGFGVGAASVDTINQSITYYIDEKRPSNIRLFGFVTGKLVTATVALDGILKIIERLAKSRW